MLTDEELTEGIIGAAIEVHRCLGPGLLESAYHACLLHELEQRGFNARSEVLLPVRYKDITVESGYRIDLLVNDRVIIELKAVDRLAEIHTAQTLTYLKLSRIETGLILNFNSTRLMSSSGFKRVVNQRPSARPPSPPRLRG